MLSIGVRRKTGDDARTNRTSGSKPIAKKVQSKLFTFRFRVSTGG